MKSFLLQTLLATFALAQTPGWWPNANFSNVRTLDKGQSIKLPVTIGDQQWQVEVAVTQFWPNVTSSDIEDPRAVATTYTFTWPGNQNLADAMVAAEDINTNFRQPRLCMSMPAGKYSADVTNDYESKEKGDCTSSLGKKCAAQSMGFGWVGAAPRCNWWPDECETPGGGLRFQEILRSQSSSYSSNAFNNLTSPYSIVTYVSDLFNPRDDGDVPFEAERQRLQCFVLYGKQSYEPTCFRIYDTEVDKSSPATGGVAKGVEAKIAMLMALVGLVSAYVWL